MENKQIFSSESSWKTNNGTFQMMDVLLAILHPFQQYMYQDDGPVIMKGVCNGTLFTAEKILPQARLEPGNARSAGQR